MELLNGFHLQTQYNIKIQLLNISNQPTICLHIIIFLKLGMLELVLYHLNGLKFDI